MPIDTPIDLPLRPAFWNVPVWAEIGVYVLAAVVVAFLAYSVRQGLRKTRAHCTAPDSPAGRDGRLSVFLAEVLGQRRILRTAAGKAHAAVFWGFLLLFAGTAAATLDWDVGHYVFGGRFLKGPVYLGFKLVLDLAGLATLIGLGFAACRRFVRLDPCVEPTREAAAVLGYLAGIILTGFLVEALRLAVQDPAWGPWSPVGWALSRLLRLCDPESLGLAHQFVWILHGLAALAFIAAIPLTYYTHVYKTPLAIWWRKAEPAGAVPKIDNLEEQETFGVSRFSQYGWRDRVRFEGCTNCGRCQGVCPAFAAGSELNPRLLVQRLKARVGRKDGGEDLTQALGAEALFDCTTCGACADICPARIPIPDLIVDLRRHIALETGEFPEGLAGALENAAGVGNPWGMDPGSRLDWAEGLDVPVAEPGQKVDILYWVGCAASYDRRAQKIARAMVKLLKASGKSFAVLAEERCHGEFGRRAGEEALFQMACEENIANISAIGFGELLVACPHCYNTFKNEYPQFEGGAFNVTHHAAWIVRMVSEGRIKLAGEAGDAVLHDPCYLARVNGDAGSARQALRAAGLTVKLPARQGADTFCCGAGGAQIFMDKPARINVIRLKELDAAGAPVIATACPHCLTMLESARAQSQGEGAPVADIAEIAAARLAGD